MVRSPCETEGCLNSLSPNTVAKGIDKCFSCAAINPAKDRAKNLVEREPSPYAYVTGYGEGYSEGKKHGIQACADLLMSELDRWLEQAEELRHFHPSISDRCAWRAAIAAEYAARLRALLRADALKTCEVGNKGLGSLGF